MIQPPPEEFLKWRIILAEQVKNNGYGDNADNSMNLTQAMLTAELGSIPQQETLTRSKEQGPEIKRDCGTYPQANL
jgi:hypothetical protein